MSKLTELATIIESDAAPIGSFDRMVAANELARLARHHAQSYARIVCRAGDHSLDELADALGMTLDETKKYVGWEQLRLDLPV